MKVDVNVAGWLVGYVVSFKADDERTSCANSGWTLTRSGATKWIEKQWAIATRWSESAERVTTTT